jgi:hypothetical protein
MRKAWTQPRLLQQRALGLVEWQRTALLAVLQDVLERRSRTAKLRRHAVHLAVAFVADHQAMLCIVHREPVRHVAQRSVEPQILLGEGFLAELCHPLLLGFLRHVLVHDDPAQARRADIAGADDASADRLLRMQNIGGMARVIKALLVDRVKLFGRHFWVIANPDRQPAHLHQRHAGKDVCRLVAIHIQEALIEQNEPALIVPDREAVGHRAEGRPQQRIATDGIPRDAPSAHEAPQPA